MKNKSMKVIMAVVFGLSAVLNSCVSDLDISNLDSSIAIDQSLVMPVGSSTLTLKDILTQFRSIGVYAPNGSNEVYFQKIDTTIPDYNLSFDFASYTVPFSTTQPVPAVPGGMIPANTDIPTINIPGNLDLGVNKGAGTQSVDSLIANSASLDVSLDASSDLTGIIKSSDITVEMDFGNRMKITGGVNPTFKPAQYGTYGSVNIPAFVLFGLANGTTGARTNMMPFTFKITINRQSSNIIISPSTFVKLNIKFKNIDYTKVYGDFDPSTLGAFNNQFAPALDKLIPNSFLSFVNPIFIIRLKSNVGSNVVLNLDSIRSLNTSTKPSWTYKYCTFGNGTKTSKTIKGPTSVGSWLTDSLVLDRSNGKTDMLFDSVPSLIPGQFLYPDWIQYKLNFSKDNSSTRAINYITKDARLKIEVETRIPLNFKVKSYYSLADTMDNVSASIGTSLDIPEKYGKEARLIFTFKNGLPSRASVTIDLLDAAGKHIDNFTYEGKTYSANDLYSQFPYKINAPQVDANGNFLAISPQTQSVILTNTAIKALKMTKTIIYNIKLEGRGADNPTVTDPPLFPMHFSQQNSFSVKMGLYVKGNGSKLSFQK
jgi:hypothetical protein